MEYLRNGLGNENIQRSFARDVTKQINVALKGYWNIPPGIELDLRPGDIIIIIIIIIIIMFDSSNQHDYVSLKWKPSIPIAKKQSYRSCPRRCSNALISSYFCYCQVTQEQRTWRHSWPGCIGSQCGNGWLTKGKRNSILCRLINFCKWNTVFIVEVVLAIHSVHKELHKLSR